MYETEFSHVPRVQYIDQADAGSKYAHGKVFECPQRFRTTLVTEEVDSKSVLFSSFLMLYILIRDVILPLLKDICCPRNPVIHCSLPTRAATILRLASLRFPLNYFLPLFATILLRTVQAFARLFSFLHLLPLRSILYFSSYFSSVLSFF